jgi:hypothetical protein
MIKLKKMIIPIRNEATAQDDRVNRLNVALIIILSFLLVSKVINNHARYLDGFARKQRQRNFEARAACAAKVRTSRNFAH